MTKIFPFPDQMSGADLTLHFPVKIAGVSEDLSTATSIEFGLGAGAKATDGIAITKTYADDEITLVDDKATLDAAEVALTSAETEPITGKRYYELRIVDAEGRVGFSHSGTIKFLPNMLES